MEYRNILREHLKNNIHLSLATSNENIPWIKELHFAFDNDFNLYFRSLESKRHSQ